MPRQTKDERFASHLPEILLYHSKILADGPRIAALKRSVEMYVRKGRTFLDVGSGAGVWAILAAKLGASRVVAVELEEGLIPVIFKHAQENGVADRIEIIHGNIDNVQLNGKFDVIVAELFAGDVFSESTTSSMIGIRNRFLAEGGVLLPQLMQRWAAPLIKSIDGEKDFDLPVTTNFLNGLLLNYGSQTSSFERSKLKFAAEPKLLTQIDYLTVEVPPAAEMMLAEWTLDDVSKVDSVIVYCTTQYAPGVILDTWKSDTWFGEKFEFTPFDVKAGTLRIEANLDSNNPGWSISLPSHPDRSTQSFSPVFAYTRARMAFATTPYKKARKSRKARD